MKNGGKNKSVAFKILFSIYTVYIYIYCTKMSNSNKNNNKLTVWVTLILVFMLHILLQLITILIIRTMYNYKQLQKNDITCIFTVVDQNYCSNLCKCTATRTHKACP